MSFRHISVEQTKKHMKENGNCLRSDEILEIPVHLDSEKAGKDSMCCRIYFAEIFPFSFQRPQIFSNFIIVSL